MLIIHDPHAPQSRYSHYLAELLRLEGIMSSQSANLSDLSATTLIGHDMVVLPRTTLDRHQIALLCAYVTTGGTLLALLPDNNLVTALGITPCYQLIPHGQLTVGDTTIVAEPIDVIGPTAIWQVPDDATIVANINQHPAIVSRTIGAGNVLLYAFDVAYCVARLRQGDPQYVDLCAAGLDGIYRPSELFVHQLDPQRAHIPQADLHTALLAHLIMTHAPQPRIWYYPRAQQTSTMIMTSDDDWSQVAEFEALIAGLARHDAQCTFFLVPQSRVTPSDITRWQAAGHTFSVHPALAQDIVVGLATDEPQVRIVAAMLAENITRHQREYAAPVRTIRQHAVRWLGYVEAARVLASHGVQLDCNYLAVSPYLGYVCGSGRAVRFVDEHGQIIDCFQQPTLWTEECLIHPAYVFSFKWEVAHAIAVTDQLIAAAAQRYYTPVTINSHPVSFATYSQPLIEANWQAARRHGMPIVSADTWLDWTTIRDQIRLHCTNGMWMLTTNQPLDCLSIIVPPNITASAPTTTVIRWGISVQVLELPQLNSGTHTIGRTASGRDESQ
jgi:hypothetical protein